MKGCGNAGSRIVNFKTVYGMSNKNFESFANADGPVVKITLEQKTSICFTDTDGDSHKIKNSKSYSVDVLVFYNNIVINQEQVTISDIN